MRLRIAVIAAVVLAVPAIAHAAPSGGVYHGVVNGTVTNGCGGNEGEGFFRLQGGDIVAPNGFAFCGSPGIQPQILAPSSFHCNQLNARLETDSIPVQGGSFLYKGTAPIGPMGANRKVTFKGTWASNSKVTGKTRIKGDGCDHTDKWTMRKI
jgi:hypothetical protein